MSLSESKKVLMKACNDWADTVLREEALKRGAVNPIEALGDYLGEYYQQLGSDQKRLVHIIHYGLRLKKAGMPGSEEFDDNSAIRSLALARIDISLFAAITTFVDDTGPGFDTEKVASNLIPIPPGDALLVQAIANRASQPIQPKPRRRIFGR